jgi:predicted transcriptional regulator
MQEGGIKMIMNSVELETLKLCAMGRFMPCSIAGKYDLPELRISMLNFLVKKGYLKTVKGDEKCYRLSRRGRDILYNAGYRYPDDSRPRKEGSIFKRRIINAEINVRSRD